MKRRIISAAWFLIVSVIALMIIGQNAIFQRGNPVPYLEKMLTLSGNNHYAKVFVDEGVYITKLANHDELIKHIQSVYDVTFLEQLGSEYTFFSPERTVSASTEIYWKFYLVWEVTVHVRGAQTP